MSAQVAESLTHTIRQEAVRVNDEWIEIPSDRPGSRFFVRPNSYFLMDPEERERRWAYECDNNCGVAAEWIAAILRKRARAAERRA
jgi:hypothetical protein